MTQTAKPGKGRKASGESKKHTVNPSLGASTSSMKQPANSQRFPGEWALCILLALLPLAYLIFHVVKYHVDVPSGDQWDMIPLFEKSFQGTITFHDLWEQKAEHRPLFQRIIVIALARFSNWNISYEIGFNVCVAIASMVGLAALIVRSARRLGVKGAIWAIPLVSIIFFGLNQWEDWLWGYGMYAFLNVFSLVYAMLALSSQPLRWKHLVAGFAMGVLSTYSTASGVLLWPLGFLVLFFNHSVPAERRRNYLIAWAVVGLMVTASYLYGYHKPAYHPSMSVLFHHPARYVYYVFIYLGTPIVGKESFIFYSALANGAVIAGLSYTMVRERRAAWSDLSAYLALALYSLGTAMLTGVGRLGFGPDQAQSPRYVTLAVPYWIATVVLIYLYLKTDNRRNASEVPAPVEKLANPGLRRVALVGILCVIMGRLTATSFFSGHRGFVERHEQFEPVRAALLTDLNKDLVSRVYADQDLVRERLAILKKYGLSVYRPQ